MTHTLAIKSDGSLWGCGTNRFGELGSLKNKLIAEFVKIGDDKDWKVISAGEFFSLGIKVDNTLWAWGSHYCGQLGLGDINNNVTIPTKIGKNKNWKSISAGLHFAVAIKTDGTLWAWGDNAYGQLGLGDRENRDTPQKIGADTDWEKVSCGTDCTIAQKNNGKIYRWGSTIALKEKNIPEILFQTTPVQVNKDTDWAQIITGAASYYALKKDGTLWVWGINSDGNLGLGDTQIRCIPTKINNDTDWYSISTKFNPFIIAIKTDGSLWGWGRLFGEDKIKKKPFQMSLKKDWDIIEAGGQFYCFALKTDGTLWAWGDNTFGQLGLGDKVSRKTFTKVNE